MPMQASYVSGGDVIDYSPSSAVSAGQVVVLGGFVGIAKLDIAANRLGALHTNGLFRISKITGAIARGAALFWAATGDPVGGTAGTGALSTNQGAGVFVGFAAAAALSGDTTVLCKVVDHGVPTSALANVITDPGATGAIPVTASGSVQIVTAAAETRTLAVPTFVGQGLALSMKTDGGDAVITVAAAFNQTGNNTITMNDAGDTIVLVAIQSGSNYRWRVMFNDGCTLATV